MALARFTLWFSALAWAAFGAMLLVFPERLGGVGLVVDSSLARVEVRGFYGGLELGIAAFLAWSALAPSRFRAGLMGALLIIGGLAAGRIVGFALEGAVEPVMLPYLGAELGGAVLAAVALARLPRAPHGA
jgi:hypothetical protein